MLYVFLMLGCFLICLVLFYVGFMMFRRLWVYYFNTSVIAGSDYHMLKWSLQERRRCYFLSEFEFSDSILWDDLETQLMLRVNQLLQKKIHP